MGQGRISASHGHIWEQALSRTHDVYRKCALADIIQLPVPTAPAPSKYTTPLRRVHGIGEEIYGMLRVRISKQGFDFIGSMGCNAGPDRMLWRYFGRAIAMEAKYSESYKTSLPIIAEDKRGFGVKEHQLQALAVAYMDFGAVSLIVWCNEGKRLVLMPDMVLTAYKRFRSGGRKSVPVGEFTTFEKATYPDAPDCEDYLFAVRQWLNEHGLPAPFHSKDGAYEMIQYQYNSDTKIVTVGREQVKAPATVDQSMLDFLAVDAESPDDFMRMVRNLGRADERAVRGIPGGF